VEEGFTYNKLHGPFAVNFPADVDGTAPALGGGSHAGPVGLQPPDGGREGRVLQHLGDGRYRVGKRPSLTTTVDQHWCALRTNYDHH